MSSDDARAQPGRVVITGATGLVGRPLVRALVADGHAVTALVRDAARARAAVGAGVELVEVADLETPGPWLDTLADDTCEVLAFEPAATVNTGDAGGDRTAHDEPFV